MLGAEHRISANRASDAYSVGPNPHRVVHAHPQAGDHSDATPATSQETLDALARAWAQLAIHRQLPVMSACSRRDFLQVSASSKGTRRVQDQFCLDQRALPELHPGHERPEPTPLQGLRARACLGACAGVEKEYWHNGKRCRSFHQFCLWRPSEPNEVHRTAATVAPLSVSRKVSRAQDRPSCSASMTTPSGRSSPGEAPTYGTTREAKDA